MNTRTPSRRSDLVVAAPQTLSAERHRRARQDVTVTADLDLTVRSVDGAPHQVLGRCTDQVLGRRLDVALGLAPHDMLIARCADPALTVVEGSSTLVVAGRRAARDWLLARRGDRLHVTMRPPGAMPARAPDPVPGLDDGQDHEVLAAIFHASPDAIKVLDPSMRIVAASTGVMSIHGRTISERIGRTPFDIVHPDERAGLEAALQNVVTGQMQGVRMTYRTRHKDGHYVPVETCAERWTDARGNTRGVVLIERDHSDTIAATRALRHAKERAEDASTAKSEFMSRMSHELRTPLNAILGFGEVLSSAERDEDDTACLSQVMAAGRHLLRLVDEILDLSRIEAGKLDLRMEPVDLATEVQECLDVMASTAAKAEVHLCLTEAVTARASADRQRVKQIVLNLLSNAIKFNTPGGFVHVHLDDGPDGAVVQVSNTGTPIAPDLMPALFTPFERLGASNPDGSGLGLAVSKHLAEAMGGTMRVTASTAELTTFELRLEPAPETHRAAVPPATGQGGPARPAAPCAVGTVGTIMYVEDNLANMQVAARFLQDRPGITMLCAHDGRSGLDMLRSRTPDLLLLDLHMPAPTGEDVLAYVRADPRFDHMPVVVVSADAIRATIDRAMAAGADAYLTKPYSRDQLLGLVDRHLAADGADDAGPAPAPEHGAPLRIDLG